ncbi:unnamed protein product [Cuscuta campestris]|uniref:DNA helicase Pif1-like 2B domain-containing protein n=1 Tax=Cuscuta campestris TaxID=132261 RepID=A0A484MZ18_9ASTE|nr:unnamed protein product [Cuscuta campestris]
MPPHVLTLKEGIPVLMLCNINPGLGLCNGTRLVIHHLGHHVIRARIITGKNIGTVVDIPRIIITSNDAKYPFVLKRRQYPLRICYAMTINKSQAASRVTQPQGLHFMIKEKDPLYTHHTRNIVYKEVFNNITQEKDNTSPTL